MSSAWDRSIIDQSDEVRIRPPPLTWKAAYKGVCDHFRISLTANKLSRRCMTRATNTHWERYGVMEEEASDHQDSLPRVVVPARRSSSGPMLSKRRSCLTPIGSQSFEIGSPIKVKSDLSHKGRQVPAASNYVLSGRNQNVEVPYKRSCALVVRQYFSKG